MDEIDPIEELHEIRRRLYAEAGGTPEAYVRYLRAFEEARQKDLAKKTAKSQPSRRTVKRRKAAAR